MEIFAFILAVLAAVLFAVRAFRQRPVELVSLGLCVLTVAWIVQSVHPVQDVIIR